MDFFGYALNAVRNEAKELNRAYDLIEPAKPTGLSRADIKKQIQRAHPDVWLLIQDEALTNNVLEAMAHLIGRSYQLNVEDFQDGN
jgi:sarcosine oxidase gamma subunit